MQRPPVAQLRGPATTTSARERALVRAARERQRARWGRDAASDNGGPAAASNGSVEPRVLARDARLEVAAEAALSDAYQRGTLSARAHHRVLRVARTIADLDDSECVARGHVLEALAFRQDEALERPGPA
jgi:magnesium chelatase family protein